MEKTGAKKGSKEREEKGEEQRRGELCIVAIMIAASEAIPKREKC
jgi:hypothetical protein